MLHVEKLVAGYGNVTVIHEASLSVEKGETVALLGPNGAGKSTLMGAIIGTVKPLSGIVSVEGVQVAGQPTHRIMSKGIALVPEGRRIFAPFTVYDNLRIGSLTLQAGGGQSFSDRLDYVYRLFPRLKERAAQAGGTLSGGEQQMLAIARALMSNPRILLLDEPFLGLAPKIVEEIRAALDVLCGQGLTLLLVEQKLDIALEVAARAYVLMKGKIILKSSSAQLKQRRDLNDLYFSLAGEAA